MYNFTVAAPVKPDGEGEIRAAAFLRSSIFTGFFLTDGDEPQNPSGIFSGSAESERADMRDACATVADS